MDVSINIYREMEPFYHGLQRLIYLQVAEGQKRKLFAGPSLPSLSEPGSICLLRHYPDSRRLATPTKQPQSIPQRIFCDMRLYSLALTPCLSFVCLQIVKSAVRLRIRIAFAPPRSIRAPMLTGRQYRILHLESSSCIGICRGSIDIPPAVYTRCLASAAERRTGKSVSCANDSDWPTRRKR